MLNVLESVAYKAGEIVLPFFYRHITVQEKMGHQSLVSEADFASQTFVETELKAYFKSVGLSESAVTFLGEEGLDQRGNSSLVVIVDPLDGTANFISNNPYFAISIAIIEDGLVKYGVTYNPVAKTLYKVEKGNGAWKVLDGSEIKLSIEKKLLKESNLNTYYTSHADIRHQMFKITEALYPHIRGMRIWGSGTLELAQFTENLTNVVLYGKCGIWDIAVAQLLIEESGGSLTDWQGKPLELNLSDHDATYQILACHPGHLEELTEIIQSALNS